MTSGANCPLLGIKLGDGWLETIGFIEFWGLGYVVEDVTHA